MCIGILKGWARGLSLIPSGEPSPKRSEWTQRDGRRVETQWGRLRGL